MTLHTRIRGNGGRIGGVIRYGAATPPEGVVATTIDGLTASKADSYVALEADVIARWELESIETGQQAVRVRIVLPVSKDTGIRGTPILIRDQILVLHIVLHGFGNTRAGETSING